MEHEAETVIIYTVFKIEDLFYFLTVHGLLLTLTADYIKAGPGAVPGNTQNPGRICRGK
jgi:hypothetical protein